MKEMTLEEFRNVAKNYNVIPVWQKLFADNETPLTLYRKLAKNQSGTFLLESAEHGGAWSRYSFIGVASQATLTEKNGVAFWEGSVPAVAPIAGEPLEAFKKAAEFLKSPKFEELPPLTGGLVGYLSYDAVRNLEKLPSLANDDLRLPTMAYMLTTDLAIFDHQEGSITLIANAINWDGSDNRIDEAYAESKERLAKMIADLKTPLESLINTLPAKVAPDFKRDTNADVFKDRVEKIKEEIRSGEAFQVVLSQRFSIDLKCDPLDVYRVLRVHNPSPYMYLLRFANGLDIVGSSPEALVKVTGKEVMVHPIAGTRKRSADPETDKSLGDELLADPKERAEHIMLVDLGRNDLGRVCEAGSVEVVQFMQIERYSHVMHIVSTVTGKLMGNKSAIDALYAVFPAGTLSGAPKPRAMEIIESLEDVRRGIYGGTIGYIDFNGNLDTCIAIRTTVIKDGIAYVQAGAGVVADSDPESENQECLNKAAAVLGAIASANAMVKA
jgi:anthranilate synthase component 1